MPKQDYYSGGELHPQMIEHYLHEFGAVDRVLDLGCGRGDLGKHTSAGNVTVVGLDEDETALSLARKHEEPVRFDLEARSLPFPGNCFDAVLAKDVLEHVSDPLSLVNEVHRVLRPGGKVVASIAMAKPRVVWDDYTHRRGFTGRAARQLFRDGGFRVQVLRKWGKIPLFGRLNLVPWLPWVLKLPLMGRWFARSWGVVSTKPGS